MDINGKFKSVTESDLYDFYGIASLRWDQLDADQQKIAESVLITLQKTYQEALLKRFAHWSPGGGKPLDVLSMIKMLKDSLYDEANKQAKKMAMDGRGFDLMSAVKLMRGEAEGQKEKVIDQQNKQFAANLASFESPSYKGRYTGIAQGVIKLHEAKTPPQIIQAIDFLNLQQHWGGQVLVDFLCGQRKPDDPEATRIFLEVMEIKKNAKTPLEYASKMSSDIRKLVFDVYGKHQLE